MPITEEDIQRIKKFEKQLLPKYPYWYGNKKILYDYVGLPAYWPASVHLQHGANTIYRNGKPDHLAMTTKYPTLFLSNKKQAEVCKQFIEKPIHVIGSLFPYYRKMNKIERSKDAKGTLAFPTHSTKDISAEVNWKGYAEELKALPEQYHPICVSLYFIDVLKGAHKYFEEAGLDVCTNGHIADDQFVERFYENMHRHQYTTGNEIGSFMYYAIEMEIPFFTYGSRAAYKNFGANKDAPDSKYTISKKHGYEKHEQARAIFYYDQLDHVEIRQEQRDFVTNCIGTNDAISKEAIKEIIIQSTYKFLWKELLWFPLKFPYQLLRRGLKLLNIDFSIK